MKTGTAPTSHSRTSIPSVFFPGRGALHVAAHACSSAAPRTPVLFHAPFAFRHTTVSFATSTHRPYDPAEACLAHACPAPCQWAFTLFGSAVSTWRVPQPLFAWRRVRGGLILRC